LNFKKLTTKTQGKGSLPCKSPFNIVIVATKCGNGKRAKRKLKQEKEE
jgi:hypothetical protein